MAHAGAGTVGEDVEQPRIRWTLEQRGDEAELGAEVQFEIL